MIESTPKTLKTNPESFRDRSESLSQTELCRRRTPERTHQHRQQRPGLRWRTQGIHQLHFV